MNPEDIKTLIDNNIQRVRQAMVAHGIDPDQFEDGFIRDLAKVLLWEEQDDLP